MLHQNEHPDDAVLSGSATGAPPNPGSETAEGSAIALEATPSYWRNIAQSTLQQHLLLQPNTNRAKNVIYFLGDGMSLPTIVAARMYLGQQQGRSGEEGRLSFEEFPYVGLSKVSGLFVQCDHGNVCMIMCWMGIVLNVCLFFIHRVYHVYWIVLVPPHSHR